MNGVIHINISVCLLLVRQMGKTKFDIACMRVCIFEYVHMDGWAMHMYATDWNFCMCILWSMRARKTTLPNRKRSVHSDANAHIWNRCFYAIAAIEQENHFNTNTFEVIK